METQFVINTSAEQLPNGNWRAVVFEIDEDSGAKQVLAISECSTKFGALTGALNSYHAYLAQKQHGEVWIEEIEKAMPTKDRPDNNPHKHVGVGRCPVCFHYGDNCTGTRDEPPKPETNWRNVELKPFTRFDWDGWAGATSFPNGDEPLMASSKVGCLILDANGVHLTFGHEEDGEWVGYDYCWEQKFNSALQARVLAGGIFTQFALATMEKQLEALAKTADLIEVASPWHNSKPQLDMTKFVKATLKRSGYEDTILSAEIMAFTNLGSVTFRITFENHETGKTDTGKVYVSYNNISKKWVGEY